MTTSIVLKILGVSLFLTTPFLVSIICDRLPHKKPVFEHFDFGPWIKNPPQGANAKAFYISQEACK